MSIPKSANLKEIPENYNYYIQLCKENILIESEVKNQYEQSEGWRLWVNLDANASLKKYSIFNIGIIKRKEGILTRYELLEDSFEEILKYFIDNSENDSYLTSFAKVGAELGKSENEGGISFELNPLYSSLFNDFKANLEAQLQQKLQQIQREGMAIPPEDYSYFRKLNSIPSLLRIKEEVILSMQDFSQIKLNLPHLTEKQKAMISERIKNSSLTKEQDKYIPKALGFTEKFLVEAEFPKKLGTLLYGPPGTGKTTTMNAFFDIYKSLGWNFHGPIDVSKLLKPTVGGMAEQLGAQVFEPAIQKILGNAENGYKPCLIYIDEATALVTKPKDSNVSDWYQEGIDTIKRFINPERYPGIVLCVATNAKEKELDDGLVQNNRRLRKVLFNFLSEKQFKSLWEVKLKNFLEVRFDKNEILQLAQICANLINGAVVNDFCESYREVYNKNDMSFKQIIEKSGQIKKVYYEKITFEVFHKRFLKFLFENLQNNVKLEVEEIDNRQLISEFERENRIKRVIPKFLSRLKEIEELLLKKYNYVLELDEEFLEIYDKFSRIQSSDVKLEERIKEFESSAFFQHLFMNNFITIDEDFKNKLNFVEILKKIYLAKKSIIKNSNDTTRLKLKKFEILIKIVENIQDIFNDPNYTLKLNFISDQQDLYLFLENLYLNIDDISDYLFKIKELIEKYSNTSMSFKDYMKTQDELDKRNFGQKLVDTLALFKQKKMPNKNKVKRLKGYYKIYFNLIRENLVDDENFDKIKIESNLREFNRLRQYFEKEILKYKLSKNSFLMKFIGQVKGLLESAHLTQILTNPTDIKNFNNYFKANLNQFEGEFEKLIKKL